jgi:SRSO17 transposase
MPPVIAHGRRRSKKWKGMERNKIEYQKSMGGPSEKKNEDIIKSKAHEEVAYQEKEPFKRKDPYDWQEEKSLSN